MSFDRHLPSSKIFPGYTLGKNKHCNFKEWIINKHARHSSGCLKGNARPLSMAAILTVGIDTSSHAHSSFSLLVTRRVPSDASTSVALYLIDQQRIDNDGSIILTCSPIIQASVLEFSNKSTIHRQNSWNTGTRKSSKEDECSTVNTTKVNAQTHSSAKILSQRKMKDAAFANASNSCISFHEHAARLLISNCSKMTFRK